MMETGIYMNNAATSWPKPICVAEAVANALTSPPGSANRGGIEDFDVFDAVRKALCELIGVRRHERIAFGNNATWGLNLAIQGFPLSEGDAVITSEAEHNSILRPLYKMYKEKHIHVVCVPVDAFGRIQPHAWKQAVIENKPRLCVLTHASNVTGAVNDAQQLAGIAKDSGAAVLMDVSQTLGCIDVRAEDWGVDMLAFTGHKYLLGPQGTGGLYVRPGLTLSPLLVGGTGVKSDLKEMPEEMPLHLEAGTGNEPSYHGLLAALIWRKENPPDNERVTALMERLKQGLIRAGAAVIAPIGECTPVVSFNIAGKSADEVGYILAESYDITCRSGLHCAPKIFGDLGCSSTVRLSISQFTTEREVDVVILAVKDIVG